MHPPNRVSIKDTDFYYSDTKFKRRDAFIGFQKDTPASVVFQATNLLRSATKDARVGKHLSGGKWEEVFQWCMLEQESRIIEEEVDTDTWKKAVSLYAMGDKTKIFNCYLI